MFQSTLRYVIVFNRFLITNAYILKNPADSPHPEQTSSWLSMVLYIWLDPIVFKAYRVPHLSHEELPPLADHDYSRNLKKKSFPVSIDITVIGGELIIVAAS